MASGNAKRKRQQQQRARHSADKSHERDRTQSHKPLPKVGTRPEQEHLHRQRQADLVDFGRGGRHRSLGIGLVVLALVLLLALGLLAVGGWKALGVHLDRFVITNMRVFRINGVLAQSLATMPLTRILDITVKKPLMGRLLGYGHFVFESAAQAQGLRDIHFVGRPDERDLTIQRVVQRSGLRKRLN